MYVLENPRRAACSLLTQQVSIPTLSPSKHCVMFSRVLTRAAATENFANEVFC